MQTVGESNDARLGLVLGKKSSALSFVLITEDGAAFLLILFDGFLRFRHGESWLVRQGVHHAPIEGRLVVFKVRLLEIAADAYADGVISLLFIIFEGFGIFGTQPASCQHTG